MAAADEAQSVDCDFCCEKSILTWMCGDLNLAVCAAHLPRLGSDFAAIYQAIADFKLRRRERPARPN